MSNLLNRMDSLGRNTAGQPNRAPLIVDANQSQHTAAAVDQSEEAVSVQQADAASSAQLEVTSRHSSADGSGAEPVSRSPSLLEADGALDWILPLVDAEYRPQAGTAIPAEATASIAPTGSDDVPVFAEYGRPFSLDIAVSKALKSVNPSVTALLNLEMIVTNGTVGPVLDKELVKTFNLDMQLEHRFVEKEFDGRLRTFVFSYDPGEKQIKSVHPVEFEGASTSPLRPNQKVRINGVKRTLSIERERGSGQLMRVGIWVNTRLKATVKGVRTRLAQQREFQAITPYPNRAHYALATKAFGGATGNSSERTMNTAGEWQVYRSTRAVSLLKEQSAVLHSFRMGGHLQGALAELEAPPRKGKDAVIPLGHIYRPLIGHNMKVNSAWMLGLAHHQVPAVLTTPLTRQLLLRRTRKDEDVEPLSALCRELVGLLQNGYFRVQTNESGRKTLVPTEEAKAATLKSMQVPRERDLNEVIAILNENGLPVVPKAEDVPRTKSKFNAEHWWRELVMQDLEGEDDSFPNLNTVIGSGMQVPFEIFHDLFALLIDLISQEFRELVLAHESVDSQDPIKSKDKQNIQNLLNAKTRIPDFLVRILSGTTDDAMGSRFLVDLGNHLFLFKDIGAEEDIVGKMIDLFHERAVEIKDVRMRMDLLNHLMHNIIALEVAGTSGDVEDFPLLAHALNAKVLNPHYQMWRAVKITDAMYEKLPLTGALCRTAVADINAEGHPDTMRAIYLGLKIVDLLKSDEERRVGLEALAYGIRNVTNPHEWKWLSEEVMNWRNSLSSAVHRDVIAQKVAYSLIKKELDAKDTNVESIRQLLAKFDIPMHIDLACAVLDGMQSNSAEEQHRQLTLASAIVAAAPRRNQEGISEHALQQVIQFIGALEFMSPGDMTEPNSLEPRELIKFALKFADDYLQGAELDDSIWKRIDEALAMSLTRTRTIAPEEAIEFLRDFGISDLTICKAASTQVNSDDQTDDEHALDFVLHCANTMKASARTHALESLIAKFRKSPFHPSANDIVETVARQISASKLPDAADRLSERKRANLARELAGALVNFDLLDHMNGLDMLIAYSSVPDARKLIDQLFAAETADLTDAQMRVVQVVLDQIDSMRTAEKYYAGEPRVQVLGNLVKALPEIANDNQEVFHEVCEFMKLASDATMDEQSRHYLTQELLVSLDYVDANNTDALLAVIEQIEWNLEKLCDDAIASKLSLQLIAAGASIFSKTGDVVARRAAIDTAAGRFGIKIADGIGMNAASWSDFVAAALPQAEEGNDQQAQEDIP